MTTEKLEGKKCKGFKFDSETHGYGYLYAPSVMDKYIGEIGIIIRIHRLYDIQYVTIKFADGKHYIYPFSESKPHLIKLNKLD